MTRRSLTAFVATALVASSTFAPPADAVHPPQTSSRILWDDNGDNVPDTVILVYANGANWFSTRLSRLHDAIAAWEASPDNYVNFSRQALPAPPGSQHYIYQDGTTPHCGAFPAGGVARSCVQWRGWNGSFYGIFDVDTYLKGGGINWLDSAPSSSSHWDGEGTLVHELGHWGYLTDLFNGPEGTECDYVTAMHTMCLFTSAFPPSKSYEWRTLTSSDVRDMTRLYPGSGP